MNQLAHWIKILLTLCLAILAALFLLQRKLIFYPSHRPETNGLTAWNSEGRIIGYARAVAHPGNVWLLLHGNAGQAADRVYALSCFSDSDSVYILEYPGYGARAGSPSKASFDLAAQQAYRLLRSKYPGIPVCVVGESIGSGPASMLAKMVPQPDKLVLVTPFDTLVKVARHHFPLIPAGLILLDRWNNIEALQGFSGKLAIYGALDDQVIPLRHASALAKSHPGTVFHQIPGGHNDWSQSGLVKIRN
jgi:uncharacterized protein